MKADRERSDESDSPAAASGAESSVTSWRSRATTTERDGQRPRPRGKTRLRVQLLRSHAGHLSHSSFPLASAVNLARRTDTSGQEPLLQSCLERCVCAFRWVPYESLPCVPS